MPDKRTIKKAREDKREGKSASTQAGEFVHEEIRKIRSGDHGARSPEQAIAIGLSEARRAGVDLPPPGKGKAKARTRRSARYAYEAGHGMRKTRRRPRVSRAVKKGPPTRTAEHSFARGARAPRQACRQAADGLAALGRSAHQRPQPREARRPSRRTCVRGFANMLFSTGSRP